MLVQKTQNVIGPSAIGDAVLSHRLSKQAHDLLVTDLDAFDQAHDHPHVGQHRRVPKSRFAEHYPFQSQFDLHR